MLFFMVIYPKNFIKKKLQAIPTLSSKHCTRLQFDCLYISVGPTENTCCSIYRHKEVIIINFHNFDDWIRIWTFEGINLSESLPVF